MSVSVSTQTAMRTADLSALQTLLVQDAASQFATVFLPLILMSAAEEVSVLLQTTALVAQDGMASDVMSQ